MKTAMIAFVLAFVLFRGGIRAQDTLVLTVDQLVKEKIALHRSGKVPFRQEDTLNMGSPDWYFKIANPNNRHFTVKLQNNMPLAVRSLPELTAVYPVKNNRLQMSGNLSIEFGSSFSIRIVSDDNTITSYDLTCVSHQVSNDVNAGSGMEQKTPSRTDHQMGVLYYDVMFLNDPAADPDMKLRILAYYADTSLAGLDAALRPNRFLYPEFKKWSSQRKPGAQSLQGIATAAMSSVGGLDVTSVADGFARFIVRRAKTELNIAFFDKFRQAISDSSFRDLRTLFPGTYLSLNLIGEQLYNYELYLQVLRESFETDLRNLPANLPGIVDNHPEFFAKYPELLASVQSAFYVADGLLNRVHPGEIIAGYPLSFLDDEKLVNWKGSMLSLQLLSESLRNHAVSGDETYWVSEKQVRDLVLDKEALQIFIGLMRQRATNAPYYNIRFAGNTSLVAAIDRLDPALFNTWYPAYRDYITGFMAKATQVQMLIATWPKSASDSLTFAQYYRFFNASVDLVEQSAAVGSLPGLENSGIRADLGICFETARTASNLALDVTRRNYASAVLNAAHIYDLILVKKSTSTNSKQLAGHTVQTNDVRKTYDLIFRYGSFMATVVQAKTSDDVAGAIEAAALPSGSSRVKRETSFNVALNAYVGLYAGYEQIRGFDTTGFTVNTYGVTAPVGISISRGHSVFFIGTGKSGWSTSAFVSLVDLGAVASFRFQDDSVSQVPTIHLQDIVSPGLFLSIGIPKCPVSVNFGVQMGPNLRKVSSAANDYSNNVYFRYSMSLVVDIPVFNFYSKAK